MPSGEDERGDGGGGEGAAHREPALGPVDVAVPPAKGLGRGEHVAPAAHVAVGALAAAVGAAAPGAGDAGDGAAGAPGGGGGAVALAPGDAVGLAAVLRDVRVDEADEVVAEGGGKDGGGGGGGEDGGGRGGVEDVDGGAGGHGRGERERERERERGGGKRGRVEGEERKVG